MEHFPISLQGHGRAYGLLTKKPPVSGVIFVHGFDGDPRATWVDFEGLIEQIGSQRSLWKNCDLYFYGYESSDQITPLAEPFLEFLTNVATFKEQQIISSRYAFPSSEKYTLGVPEDLSGARGKDPYKKLILVGHSTGAVIIREAIRLMMTDILKRYKSLASWLDKIGKTGEGLSDLLIAKSALRFFAPAHLGVMGAGKLGIAQNVPIIDRLIGGYLQSKPLYHNLKHDSPTILDLRKATERLFEVFEVEALKACSLFGQHEEIVYFGGYSHDEPTQTQAGHWHTTVCKPNVSYVKPLEFVVSASSLAKNA
jgi:hypothetical protein